MKNEIVITSLLLFFGCSLFAQDSIRNDTTSNKMSVKQRRAMNKVNRKIERKSFSQHFLIGGEVAFAKVHSNVRFEEPNGIFSATIDLESHLGLADDRLLFSGNFIYRITPRSGIYAYHYQIHRSNNYVLERDIVFLDDTLHVGASVKGFQNTNIFSFGYAFSILREEYAYLGLYFNIYFARVSAGVSIDGTSYSRSVSLGTPAPSFGILASFELTEWMRIAGGLGFMYLNTYDLGGSLFDGQVFLEFMPVKWLGISLGYFGLDVEMDVPVERFRSYINYRLNGPTVGLWFRF